MAQVAISNVAKAFGTVKVLHDVSVDIVDGQFVEVVQRGVAAAEIVDGDTDAEAA